MLFTLIATGEDTATFEQKVGYFLAQLGETAQSATPSASVPAPAAVPAPAQPAAAPDQGNGGNTEFARAMRAAYRAFENQNGRKPTENEKQAMRDAHKAGHSVAIPAQQVIPAPVASPVDALQEQLAQLQAQIAAAQTGAQPAQPTASPAVKWDTVPPHTALTPAACTGLIAWAQNLTPLRKDVVTRYAQGQATPADILSVYGDKSVKVVRKVNELLAS